MPEYQQPGLPRFARDDGWEIAGSWPVCSLRSRKQATRNDGFDGMDCRVAALLAMTRALLGGCLLLGGLLANAAESSRVPQPVIESARGGSCVADPATMRRQHMVMLRHQRDDSLRGGIRTGAYSLKACIACHASQSTNSVTASSSNFCQSCHAYAAVHIDCFECHANQPQAKP